MSEKFLFEKLEKRKQENAFRRLTVPDGKIDFSSNDYLGISRNDLVQEWFSRQDKVPSGMHSYKTGSTGSRLLSGNYPLINETEKEIAAFHLAEAGLIYNSGYDANIGLLSCVPQRGDTILYDHLSHASIRDGIRLSQAASFSFRHNDPEDLSKKIRVAQGRVFVITESVFSMDGDKAPLTALVNICGQYGAHLVVDEAHATGIVGARGAGLVQQLGLEKQVFARIHTFGKACGVHGAIVLGTEDLRDYLVNFSRAFIYTTALPEASVGAIRASYRIFPDLENERSQLAVLVELLQSAELKFEMCKSETPIQALIIPGNEAVKKLAEQLQEHGLDIRPILYPTVPEGSERLRIVLHSFNTRAELELLIRCLQ